MSKLWVIEVFSSIQGEGFHTGRMAVFVRFAGCSLKCDFCDTKYAWNKEAGIAYTPEDFFTIISAYNSKFVVLTGGEPMEQDYDALCRLIYLLKSAGYYVAIESNGVHLIDYYTMALDWVTISPKTAPFCTYGDELKLLYDGTQDLEFYEGFDFKYFYLQPMLPDSKFLFSEPNDTEQTLNAFKKVLKAVEERPIWRISFQAHKLVGFL